MSYQRLTREQAIAAGLRVIDGALGSALAPISDAPCQRCGHERMLHSYDRADDFACSACECYWDPFLAATDDDGVARDG